jgi:hypothetical protein
LQTRRVAAESLKTGIADGNGSARTVKLEFHRIIFMKGECLSRVRYSEVAGDRALWRKSGKP